MGDAKFFGKQIALLDKELETLKAKGKENDRAAEDKYKALSSSCQPKTQESNREWNHVQFQE